MRIVRRLQVFVCFCQWLGIACWAGLVTAEDSPRIVVSNVRRVFHNGEHNAFTDITRFKDRFYLTFRSCPDGHMVHPTSSIIVLASDDLQDWRQVHRFSVPLRDTRDPHFLIFKGQLFVLSGTWYCGETSPDAGQYDLNQHLGYAVFSSDGLSWSSPTMLEGTFGHYIWRAKAYGEKAYLCGRRKYVFDMRRRATSAADTGAVVESAMLVSEDGLTWKTHSLFQTERGDETAFYFNSDGSAKAISRRGRDAAQVLHSSFPFTDWQRQDLDRYVGGPMLERWGQRWVVGGRKQLSGQAPKTALYWLENEKLVEFAGLPSGGDNSYPGFIALNPSQAVVSWYSSHEVDADDRAMTAIYLADLHFDAESLQIPRQRITFQSSFDGTPQEAYLTVPANLSPNVRELKPLVVSLHSWSADMEQRQPELERLVAEKGWFCLQPNFRGINNRPEACGSAAAQQDILDAVDYVIQHHALDPRQVFLTGNSGGGHMTMMMAAKFPGRWRAASAWVGISNMADWYAKHRDGKYGAMMRDCCGRTDDSEEVDLEYRIRSPLTYLSGAQIVALDIAAGIHDGHTGSVPVRQSLEAFNTIAKALNTQPISETEIAELSVSDGRLTNPMAGDVGFDLDFARKHYLRRLAGKSRVTVFEGGHEGIASAALAWFEAHRAD